MALNRDEIIKYYPGYAWLIDSNPEVANVLDKAATEQLDVPRMLVRLQQTQWWKGTEPNVRTYQERLATDPAAVDQQRRELEAKLWDQSRSLGLNLDAATIQQQAATAIQFDINESQMVDNLVAVAQQRGYQGAQGNLGGISNSIAELRKQAANYFVPIDDNTAFQWATQVANGERNVQDFNQLFKEQSKARFSHDEQMLQQIDAGFTPADILNPVTTTLSQLMEKTVNLNDPKWSQVLDYVDPNTGKRRVASVSEAAKLARGTGEWKQTRNGQEAGATLLGNIKEMMTGQR